MNNQNARAPIVWICKEQMMRGGEGSVVMDYTPAYQYAQDIRFVSKREIPLLPGSVVRQDWEDDVMLFADQYNPLTDYIIPTGNPAAIFMIGYALGKIGKVPRFLVWRREDNHYRILDGSAFDKKVEQIFDHTI